MNITINSRTILLWFLACAVLTTGCNTENALLPDPVIVNTPGKNLYATLIKERTSLIGEIKHDTTYRVYPGVEETHIRYTNKNNLPMALFFLTVSLVNPAISLEVATPNNQNVFVTQRVRSMITYKNEADAAREVVAAFNGDYWDTATSGTPLGMVIKNGTVVKPFPTGDYYFFGILKDKTATIGDGPKYNTMSTDIKEALGGRYLLLQDKIDKTASLNKNIEPRTAVAILNPKKVVFLVVDGRQASYSNGLTMGDLAKVFLAINATDAVNLDGGGSSTFLSKDVQGAYQTINKPSDGSERSVANAWMIMKVK